MAQVIASDIPTIARAVEQALLAAANVGDLSNIYWIEDGQMPPPGITGQRDVILTELDDDFAGSQSSTVVGSGRGCAIKSGLRVALRTSLALDRHSTRRQWAIEHQPLINAITNTLTIFFPVDVDGNALTIEGFCPIVNKGSDRLRDTETWGQTIAEFHFHYVPSFSSVTP